MEYREINILGEVVLKVLPIGLIQTLDNRDRIIRVKLSDWFDSNPVSQVYESLQDKIGVIHENE